MKVLLTGATGFIGSHVARLLLSEGEQVSAIVKPYSDRWRIADMLSSMRLLHSSINDRPYLEPRLLDDVPDVCIHLAWHGWAGPSVTATENLSSLAASLEF